MIYIVTGMHRSGTSMLAGVLHHSGISMGRQFREPLPENPKGFFEEEAFRRENDRVLRQSGYTIKQWKESFQGLSITNADLTRASAVVARFNRLPEPWGWKDPRTCLTLRLWLMALQGLGLAGSTRIIVVTRDIRAVARSLLARGNVASPAHGAALWMMYNRELNKALRFRTAPPVLRVEYERLIQRIDLALLESFCARSLDTSFIDASLNRSGRPSVEGSL
jgi:O-antigen biosynthesis protein